ncbi:MAG TPA: alkaline phosphatase family protein [Candidatus Cybelea sp.]|jgi:phospholipase C|nr:alkaline phosphatase family protein [Candidatus Cybelea sp.]
MRTATVSRYALSITLAAFLPGCGGGSSPGLGNLALLAHHRSGPSPITHVVMIVQENRSYENLFATFPNQSGQVYGYEKVKKGGKWVSEKVVLKEQHLIPAPDVDIGHCYYAFVQAYDKGKMDGFNEEPHGVCERSWTRGTAAGLYPYMYVYPSDIAPYWDMAEQYVLADRMFQTQGSSSFTAHQDLIRGGSALSGTYGSASSLIDTPTQAPWGCDSPTVSRTDLISLSGKWSEDNGPYPCTTDFPNYSGSSNYQTLADLLDAASISWKYYSPCYKDYFQSSSCPAYEKSLTLAAGGTLNAFDVIASVRNGPEWGTNVSMPETNIFNDISAGNLAAVSWVVPEDCNSDHLGETNPLTTGHKACDNGPEWVASVVNAIGESPFWNTTAIVILWDDWGGLYDGAEPPTPGGGTGHQRDDQGGLGLRVPMLVVSPYAKIGTGSQGGYIDGTSYEFGSILKYIENNFDLPSLNTTDKRATSIIDAFDYNQQPRSFSAIPSKLDAHYFITHQLPSVGDY